MNAADCNATTERRLRQDCPPCSASRALPASCFCAAISIAAADDRSICGSVPPKSGYRRRLHPYHRVAEHQRARSRDGLYVSRRGEARRSPTWRCAIEDYNQALTLLPDYLIRRWSAAAPLSMPPSATRCPWPAMPTSPQAMRRSIPLSSDLNAVNGRNRKPRVTETARPARGPWSRGSRASRSCSAPPGRTRPWSGCRAPSR